MSFAIGRMGPQFVLAGGGAAFLLVLVLWALNKPLRLFTKGSVTFMVAVLMLVTVESVIERLHDIRNAETGARRAATTQTATTFLRSVFDRRPTEEICANLDSSVVPTLHAQLRTIERETARAIAPETMPDPGVWRAVSIDVNHSMWPLSPYHFTAMVDTSGSYVVIRGNIAVSDSIPPRVTSFEVQSAELMPEQMVHAFFENADYRNPAYQEIANASRGARSMPARPPKPPKSK